MSQTNTVVATNSSGSKSKADNGQNEGKRRVSKHETSALENEMKDFLEAGVRTTAYRAVHYKPTLEKFRSTSFSDYVRRVLMGVPVPGVEDEEPYHDGSSDEEGEAEEEEETRKDEEDSSNDKAAENPKEPANKESSEITNIIISKCQIMFRLVKPTIQSREYE